MARGFRRAPGRPIARGPRAGIGPALHPSATSVTRGSQIAMKAKVLGRGVAAGLFLFWGAVIGCGTSSGPACLNPQPLPPYCNESPGSSTGTFSASSAMGTGSSTSSASTSTGGGGTSSSASVGPVDGGPSDAASQNDASDGDASFDADASDGDAENASDASGETVDAGDADHSDADGGDADAASTHD